MTRTAKLLEKPEVKKAIGDAVRKAKIRPEYKQGVVQDSMCALLLSSGFLKAEEPAAYARRTARNKAASHIRSQREIIEADLKLPLVSGEHNSDDDQAEEIHAVDLLHDKQYYSRFLRQDNRIRSSMPKADFDFVCQYADRKREDGNKFTRAEKQKFFRIKNAHQLDRFRRMPYQEHSVGVVAGGSIGAETIHLKSTAMEWAEGEPSRGTDYGNLITEESWQSCDPIYQKQRFVKALKTRTDADPNHPNEWRLSPARWDGDKLLYPAESDLTRFSKGKWLGRSVFDLKPPARNVLKPHLRGVAGFDCDENGNVNWYQPAGDSLTRKAHA